MNKKKMIITGTCGSLVIGLSAFAGYEYGKQQAYEATKIQHKQRKSITQTKLVQSWLVKSLTMDM